MEIKDALKAVAPAVGDGKIVAQHSYVRFADTSLLACNGRMWASATIDAQPSMCVRHDVLTSAMDRDGATLTPDATGMWVRAGRSRLKIRGIDPNEIPEAPSAPSRWAVSAPADFRETLEVLSDFTGAADNHIWQMGVHFTGAFAFAANPYALVVRSGDGFDTDLTLPPWAIKFILSQAEAPNVIADCTTHLSFLWSHRVGLTSTLLIDGPSEPVTMMAAELVIDTVAGVVPDNLKEAVQRAASLGATRVTIGNGKIEHRTEELEFEEDIDIDCPPRIWGVAQLIDALKYAEAIDLEGERGRWRGRGFIGIFQGMSR